MLHCVRSTRTPAVLIENGKFKATQVSRNIHVGFTARHLVTSRRLALFIGILLEHVLRTSKKRSEGVRNGTRLVVMHAL